MTRNDRSMLRALLASVDAFDRVSRDRSPASATVRHHVRMLRLAVIECLDATDDETTITEPIWDEG